MERSPEPKLNLAGERKTHGDLGAVVAVAERHVAAVGPHHRARERQAQTEAGRAAVRGATEGLEDALAVGRRNRRTVVGQTEDELAVGRDQPRLDRPGATMADGVVDEIGDRTCEEGLVAADERLVGNVRDDRTLRVGSSRALELGAEEIGEIHDLAALIVEAALRAGEPEEALDKGAEPIE